MSRDAKVTTVAEVCDRHIAAVPNPRTAATYRTRLRPLTRRYGARPAREALLTIAEIENELAAEHEPQAAHKAVILLKAALAGAGFELLTLVAAAAQHKLAVKSLRALADDGRVRCPYRRTHGRGESLLFDPVELADDLARLPRCLAEDCEKAGTGSTGYCGEHFGEGGRRAARQLEANTLGTERNWYARGEAADAAPCARDTIRKAIDAGELNATKVGRHLRIVKTELHKWAKGLPPAADRRFGVSKPTAEERAERRGAVKALHDRLSQREIAEKLKVSTGTVRGDLNKLEVPRDGQGRPSGRLAPAERELRKQRTAELYQAGNSEREVVPALEQLGIESSPTQVARDLKELGIERRRTGGQPKGPPPKERTCKGCGQPFTPRFPSHNDRVYCDSCEDWKATRVEKGAEAVKALGLRTTEEAAAELLVGKHRVIDLIRVGPPKGLAAQRVAYPGMLHPLYGVHPDEIARYKRNLAKATTAATRGTGDKRLLTPLSPEYAVAKAEKDGRVAQLAGQRSITTEEAREEFRAQAERRKRDIGRHAGGRAGGKGPPDHHFRWRGRLEERHAELLDAHEVRETLKLTSDRAPSRLAAAKEVAGEDWQDHPEPWTRETWRPDRTDPRSLDPRQSNDAGKRLLKAVDRLAT